MKFLLAILTIVCLTNIANSSDLQNTSNTLQNQNNNLQSTIAQVTDQNNILQHQYLQNKRCRDNVLDLLGTESQDQDGKSISLSSLSYDSDSLSSQNDNNDKLSSHNNDDSFSSHIKNTISQDIINSPEMLNKYPILKLIQNDNINVQNITIKELSTKIKQCGDNIATVSSDILKQYENNEGYINENDKNLLGTLLWTLDQLIFPFSDWYGYLTENNNLSNVIGNISDRQFHIRCFAAEDNENEIDYIISSIIICLGSLHRDLNQIPKQYLNKTVEEVLNQAKQNYENYNEINNKKAE